MENLAQPDSASAKSTTQTRPVMRKFSRQPRLSVTRMSQRLQPHARGPRGLPGTGGLINWTNKLLTRATIGTTAAGSGAAASSSGIRFNGWLSPSFAEREPQRLPALTASQRNAIWKFTRQRVHGTKDDKHVGAGKPPIVVALFLVEEPINLDGQVLGRIAMMLAAVITPDDVEDRPLDASQTTAHGGLL